MEAMIDPSSLLLTVGRSSLQAGILVLAILWMQFLLRRQLSPRWRSALWMLVVARLLLPVSFGSAASIFNAIPRWNKNAALTQTVNNMPMESLDAPKSESTPASPPFQPSATVFAPPEQPATTSNNALAPKAPWKAQWETILFCLWLAGMGAILAHVGVSSIRLTRQLAKISPITDATVIATLDECRGLLNVRTSLRLAECESVTMPALCGVFRPSLILPKGLASTFCDRELRFIFLHELAHVKRRDLALNWVIALLQAIHWFNPLVWVAFSKWRADREPACDALALEAIGAEHNKAYGRTILRLLEGFTHRASAPGLVGILEAKNQLRSRIKLIAAFEPGHRFPALTVLLLAALSVIFLTDARDKSAGSADAKGLSPYVFTQPPGPVARIVATLHGMVLPNGDSTSGWFEWGASTNYEFSTPVRKVGDGLKVIRLSAPITGLADGGVYHYRLVARSAGGTVTHGADFQFTTGMKVTSWGGDSTGNDKVPPGLTNVVAIACGHGHSLALKADGTVVAWGGEGSPYSGYSQTRVPPGLSNVIAIAGGFALSLAIKSDGTVVAWGEFMDHTPIKVPSGLRNVIAVAAGDNHAMALKADGRIVVWDSGKQSGKPMIPTGLSNIVAIAAGSQGRCIALEAGGQLQDWFGSGTASDNVNFAPGFLPDIAAISCDSFTALALQSSGTVRSWIVGGQKEPTELADAVAIAAGHAHSVALRRNGSVTVWGDISNAPKELGQVVAVASGDLHCLALGQNRFIEPESSK